MSKIGQLLRDEAKPEYADQAQTTVCGGRPLVEQEPGTAARLAFRERETVFAVFDTFKDMHGRETHLKGQIAATFGEAAGTILASPPLTSEVDLLGVKVP